MPNYLRKSTNFKIGAQKILILVYLLDTSIASFFRICFLLTISPHKRCLKVLNPFLFIRGLSCPCSVQTSLTLHCDKLTIPWFPCNLLLVSCGDIGFFIYKKHRSSIGLEIRPQSTFTAFRALLHSENYSAGCYAWSGVAACER
jgi:hypothetical protein